MDKAASPPLRKVLPGHGLDRFRLLLAELEDVADWMGVDVDEHEAYAEGLVRSARAVEASDISGPEGVLIAALVLTCRRRLRKAERGEIS